VRTRVTGLAVLLGLIIALVAQSTAGATGTGRVVRIGEFKLSAARMAALRADWVDRILARYPAGTWAPAKMTLDNRDLALMGLPSKRVLTSHRYRVPTAIYPGGKMVPLRGGPKSGGGKGGGGSGGGSGSGAATPTVTTFAGTGFFGIRPGAWLLTVTDKEVGWCSMAHAYGSPGAYQISTAGHCGKTGDTGTVIGVLGNRPDVPVLLDFGTYSRSTGDAGIGRDWALISIYPQYQSLVSPTMPVWGGPIGMYTSQGEVVSASLLGHDLISNPAVNPDPKLVQGVVHYGHGAGIGAGGTPRAGAAIAWLSDHYAFFGAITPGDSGSASNTVGGDNVGDQREAAGINTHIFVDPTLKTGVGILAGTRATQVGATLANGQLVPYPVPAPGAP
jgi:hypothetical protein